MISCLSGEVPQRATRPLTPAETALNEASRQLIAAEDAVAKAKQQRKEAILACHNAERQLKFERTFQKNVEKAIAREHRQAERQKDLDAYAVMWAAMTPEQRQAECDRHTSLDKEHNEVRQEMLRDTDRWAAYNSHMSLEEYQKTIAPFKAKSIAQAEKTLKLMIAGEMDKAKEEGEALKKLLKDKPVDFDRSVIYYAVTGVEEQDAVKLTTFINRMNY